MCKQCLILLSLLLFCSCGTTNSPDFYLNTADTTRTGKTEEHNKSKKRAKHTACNSTVSKDVQTTKNTIR